MMYLVNSRYEKKIHDIVYKGGQVYKQDGRLMVDLRYINFEPCEIRFDSGEGCWVVLEPKNL
jgi:hypothetical protein